MCIVYVTNSLSSLLSVTNSLFSFTWHDLSLSSLFCLAHFATLISFVCRSDHLCLSAHVCLSQSLSVLHVCFAGGCTRSGARCRLHPHLFKNSTSSVLYVCFAGDRTGSGGRCRLHPHLFVHEGCSLSLRDVQTGPELSSEKTIYIYIYIYIYICRDFTYEMYYDTDF